MPVTILSNNTDIPKTVSHMISQIKKASKNPQIQDLARTFLIFPVPEKAIFNYVYDQVAYIPDEGEYQDIRTPQRSLRDHIGNCVDYTVLIGSLLYCLDIPFYIKVIEIEQGEGFEHVYVITDNYIMDPCIGQPQDGTAIKKRPHKGKFNIETHFYNYKIFNMTKLRLLQGTERTSRAAKVAKLSGNKLGILCITNCDCKRECSDMFAGLNKDEEKKCRDWCDRVKARKNDMWPSKDEYWGTMEQTLVNQALSDHTDTTGYQQQPPNGNGNGFDVAGLIEGIFGTIFGKKPDPYTPPPPQPKPMIMGIPQNTFLLIGGVVVATGIYFATRPKKKRRR